MSDEPQPCLLHPTPTHVLVLLGGNIVSSAPCLLSLSESQYFVAHCHRHGHWLMGRKSGEQMFLSVLSALSFDLLKVKKKIHITTYQQLSLCKYPTAAHKILIPWSHIAKHFKERGSLRGVEYREKHRNT